MRTALYIAIGIIAVLVFIAYVLCIMAHEADERAEQMYRKWKSEKAKLELEAKTEKLYLDAIAAMKTYAEQRKGE